MEKVILIANITILPGFEEKVKKATVALATETRKEAGSESFLIHTRSDSPQTLVFYEIYHSEDAFGQHKTLTHSAKFFEFVKGKIKDDKIEVIFLTRLDS